MTEINIDNLTQGAQFRASMVLETTNFDGDTSLIDYALALQYRNKDIDDEGNVIFILGNRSGVLLHVPPKDLASGRFDAYRLELIDQPQ